MDDAAIGLPPSTEALTSCIPQTAEQARTWQTAPRDSPRFELADAIRCVWYIRLVVKTTIYLPDELHQGIKHAAKERGTSEAELIRTAVRHELLGAPADQQERAQRRARLLAAMGKLDSSAYPSGYLDELRAPWRG